MSIVVIKEDDLAMQKHKDTMRNLVNLVAKCMDMGYDRTFADLLNTYNISDEELIWCDAFNEDMLLKGEEND